MADFNPDDYLAQKTAPAAKFDPDSYLSEKAPQTMSQGDAAKIGASQGITFGLRPFLAGVGSAAGNAYTSYQNQREMGNDVGSSLNSAAASGKQGFFEGRQGALKEQSDAASQYPKTYYGSLLGSGLATAPLTPVRSLGQAARLGAGFGTANALSSANSLSGAAGDIAGGAIFGTALHAGSAAVLKGIENLSDASDGVKNFAQKIAFKALGPYQRDVLAHQGDMSDIGQSLMDEGVVGGVPTNYEGLAKRAESALNEKGQQFEGMLNNISDAADEMAKGSPNLPAIPGQAVPVAGISKASILNNLKNETQIDSDIPSLKATQEQLGELMDQVDKSQPNSISIKDAQDLKTRIGQSLDKRGVWTKLKLGQNLAPEDQFNIAYYHSLNQGVEDAADAAAPLLGPDSLKQWQQVKQDYGALKTATVLANKRAGRDFANRFISPSDYFSGVAGPEVVKGTPLDKIPFVGPALGILNHYGRTRGNQLIAPAMMSASQGLSKIQPALNAAGAVGRAGSAALPYLEPAGQRAILGNGDDTIKGYSEGGEIKDDSKPVTPPTNPIDPNAAADVQASMRKAFHFANGGQIPGKISNKDKVLIAGAPGEIILPNSITQHPNAPELAKLFVDNIKKGRK